MVFLVTKTSRNMIGVVRKVWVGTEHSNQEIESRLPRFTSALITSRSSLGDTFDRNVELFLCINICQVDKSASIPAILRSDVPSPARKQTLGFFYSRMSHRKRALLG